MDYSVTYRTDGEDGTTAQLTGANYNNTLVGKYGTFPNVPEGDGYILTCTYGNASKTVNLDIHRNQDITVTFF